MYNSLSWFEVSAASHHQVIYLYVLFTFMVYGYLLVPRALTRVRLIPVSVSADTYLNIGANTSSPVVRLPVSTVNTVATHAYSFKPIPYFRAYTPHTYITSTQLYPHKIAFSVRKNLDSPVSVSVSV